MSEPLTIAINVNGWWRIVEVSQNPDDKLPDMAIVLTDEENKNLARQHRLSGDLNS